MKVNITAKLLIYALIMMTYQSLADTKIPTSAKAERAIASVEHALKKEINTKGLKFGAPIFIRLFKEPGILELWIASDDGNYRLFKEYEICTFSGNLGPKLKEGDRQSPEGFYYVAPARLNPNSKFHLSFNLGYPNSYDRFHGRTGSALMVHGDCVSIGCYAMTNPYIEEIYTLAVAAFKSGQPFFRVHVFPFKLDSKTLSKYHGHRWHSFWLNLKEGHDYFEANKRPPNVEVLNGKYVFTDMFLSK